MLKNILSSVALVILITSSFAQNATVKGTVTENIDGTIFPVPFANVVLKGTSTGGTTDFDGNYQFVASPGTYKIVVSFTGYVPDTLEVKLEANQVFNHNILLSKNVEVLTAVDVVATANRESEEALLMDRQEASGLKENIGAKELAKKGAADVEDGLIKVTGVSSQGSGQILVRGMGDRYNQAYINGLPVPSPDPDKKVLPLNLIPTSVVRNLNISKTYDPSFYGDMAGGAIDIRTKDFPEKPILEVKGALGYNSQVTFKDFMTYEGGKADYWGFDDGTRTVPSSINTDMFAFEELPAKTWTSLNEQDNPNPGQPFAKNMNPIMTDGAMNSAFSLTAGNFINTNTEDKSEGLGYLFIISHRNRGSFQDGTYRVVNAQDAVILDYNYKSYERNTNSSAMANLTYAFDKDNSIRFNSLFVNLSSDEARDADGRHWDYDNMGTIFNRRFTFTQSNMLSNQLTGEHILTKHDRLQLEWGLGYSFANATEPDRRQLVWFHRPNADGEEEYYWNTIDVNDQHRRYMDLNENELSARVNGRYTLGYHQDDKNKVNALTLGFDAKRKYRQQDFRIYSYNVKNWNGINDAVVDHTNPDGALTDDNHDAGAYFVFEQAHPESSWDASLDVNAAYANMEFYASEKLQLIGGARIEQGRQEVRYRLQTGTPYFYETAIIEGVDVLPSLMAKYSITKKQFLRAGGSYTLVRPNFKELTPFQYREFFGGVITEGNPNLENGNVINADVRYEAYPNRGDIFSATIFGKYLQNPIEKVSVGVGSGVLQSYQNSLSGQVAGIELEYIKKLRNVVDTASFLKDFTIGANLSYMYSEVVLDTTTGGVINNTGARPLQGASPFLVNADISWEKWINEKYKTTVTVSYNSFGRRLYAVGRQNIGDQYELPVNTLNLTWKNEINEKWTASLKAGNILNPAIQIEQVSTQGSDAVIVNSYRAGATISVGVAYSFL